VIGTLNKFAKNFSHKFFSSFQNVSSNEIYTGNPIRNKITSKGYELYKEKKFILVLGGSQGAKFFNEKLMKVLEKGNFPEKIIFQTGRKKIIGSIRNIKQVEYIDKIEEVFAQTKFVICRSGASTVAELQTYAMPAIFIPIPNSIDDHQTINAKNACKNGGGIYLSENSFSEDSFLKEITSFYNSDLKKRSKSMFNDIHKDAALRIADEIKQN
jgi:UDP-N-acetylglucosamine--N-acetylmuramyl-(pentapeptide) pyrophosphoryl-undecaprenol N-acetylglucosamine transferase